MGIPENPAKHALYKSGGTSADEAVTWYFSNMDDPSIQTPLKIKKAGGAKKDGDAVPQEALDQLKMMGFPDKKCIKALKSCDMNVERAMEWIFSHMDDPDDDVEDSEMANEESKVDVNAQY